MTNETTINKLIAMRLTVMADAYRVDIEYTSRKNNRLKRLIRGANFDQSDASIADINYSAGRKLDKSQIDRLSTCEYIADNHGCLRCR